MSALRETISGSKSLAVVGKSHLLLIPFLAWKDITSGNLDVHVLPGDHFYLKEPANENFIKNYIAKCLELSLLTNC